FPEAFLPAWPAWVDEVLPGEDEAWHLRLLEQSVVVPGAGTERLGAAARGAGVQLVMGVDEREEHGGTVYNTVLYLDADGRLLICWENYMPLARFAISAQGVDIWVAPTLATHEPWVASMRHIAREGVCHVVGVAPATRFSQVPDGVPDRERL